MADSISQQGLYQDGNSIFENVHILGTLEVTGIVNTETTIRASKFIGDGSELSGIDATTIKDSTGTTQIQGTTTGATHSGKAVFNELEVSGKLYDGDGDFGTSGQVLASDGTNTNWVNTGSLTAGAASEVGVTAVNTDSDHFLTFVDSSSGNENVKVDTNLKYNPSSNTIATIKINDLQLVGQLKDGDNSFGASGTVLTSDGTDTAWANVGTLAAGSAAKLSVTEDDTETDGRLLFSNAAGQTGGNEVKSDDDLTYNANTNTLTVANLSGTATQAANLNNHDTDGLSEGSSNLYFTTSRARGAISVGSEGTPSGNGSISYDNSTGEITFTPAAAAGTPTAITVADESSDTTCFPLFSTGATGNQSPKTGTNLTFNSSTGSLSATVFSGSGAALTNLSASALTTNTVNMNRLPKTYTHDDHVTIQATGASHDVKLDAADHIILEAGEEEDGAIFFRGNSGADSYRFAKSGQTGIEGFLSFEGLSDDRTFTFPNKDGDVAMTSDLFSGSYNDLSNKPTLNFVTHNASDELTGATYTLSSSTDQKVIFQGSSNPYIRFREGTGSTNNKAYIQWNSGGYLRLTNQESGEELRLGSGNNGLTFRVNDSNKTVYHTGNLTPFDGNYNSLSNKPTIPAEPATFNRTIVRSFGSNTTYSPSSGTKSIVVYCIAGGGGGGNATGDTSGEQNDLGAASGGGGGGASIGHYRLNGSFSASITIGGGGSGGSSGGESRFTPSGSYSGNGTIQGNGGSAGGQATGGNGGTGGGGLNCTGHQGNNRSNSSSAGDQLQSPGNGGVAGFVFGTKGSGGNGGGPTGGSQNGQSGTNGLVVVYEYIIA